MEKYDRTPNEKEWGRCVDCGEPLSEHDFMHSQGDHHEACFEAMLVETERLAALSTGR